MVTTQQVRIILDRNQNGLDGLPRFQAGSTLETGLYWDSGKRVIVPVEATGPATSEVVLLSRNLEITFDQLVRQMAMGGGGHSGRPVLYHQGIQGQSQHSH